VYHRIDFLGTGWIGDIYDPQAEFGICHVGIAACNSYATGIVWLIKKPTSEGLAGLETSMIRKPDSASAT
jgi:hypothetical protein